MCLIAAVCAGCNVLGLLGAGGAEPQGPITGRIVDGTGAPVSGVKVTAYLTILTPLAGNNGSGLIGNAGAGLTSADPYRVQAEGGQKGAFSATTDASGRFAITPDKDGAYNVEAVESETSKAWKASVQASLASSVPAGDLRLMPTGHISGVVRASQASVTDFTGTQVYIPGSSYVAITTAGGAYPAGPRARRSPRPMCLRLSRKSASTWWQATSWTSRSPTTALPIST